MVFKNRKKEVVAKMNNYKKNLKYRSLHESLTRAINR